MDFLTMTMQGDPGLGLGSDFQVTGLVEGWSSLIWTERFTDPGEFELKTPYIDETMAVLQEEMPVTLRDTGEVMQVETMEVGTNNDGEPELTVKGRSIYATYLEIRNLISSQYNTTWKSVQNYTLAEIVELIAYNGLIYVDTGFTANNTIFGRTHGVSGHGVDNVVVSETGTLAGTARPRWLTSGPMYDQIRTFQQSGTNPSGLRTIRPGVKGTSGTVVTFDTGSGGTTRGDIHRTARTAIMECRFDVYQGVDRTANVVFSDGAGHLLNLDELFSVADYRNRAWVFGSVGTPIEYDNGDGGLPRVLYIDAGSPDSSESVSDFTNNFTYLAQNELKKHNRARVISADLSPELPYKYGVDFNLGDTVTMVGKYPFPDPNDDGSFTLPSQTMRVSEYVRAQDKDGERGYPGLVIPT